MSRIKTNQLIGFRWTAFDPSLTSLIPRVPCVYAVYQHGELVYIGHTDDLRRRFAWYRHRRYRFAKARVLLHLDERVAAERRLIRRLLPPRNIVYTGRVSRRFTAPYERPVR